MRIAIALLLLSTLTAPPALAQETTVYVGATVVDCTGRGAVADGVVIVDGERISAVGKRSDMKIPTGVKVVNLRGKWLVPGLVDAHIHFFQSTGLYTRPDIVDLRDTWPYEKEVESIKARLDGTFRRYLASGITAVVDMGGPFWNFEVRKQANDTVEAPRTAVAGPLIATVDRPQMDIGDPPIIKAATEKEAQQLVRRQLEHKPDLIKIWFILPKDGNVAANLPIVKATIDEAHKGGVRVAIHATQLETARAAVEAGAEILVHSIDDKPVDQDFIKLLKNKGTLLTPTLVVYEGYAEVLGGAVELTAMEKELGDLEAIKSFAELPPELGPTSPKASARVERLRATRPVMLQNLKTLHDAGIIIAAGTDAGNIGTLHGPALHREFELMAKAGLTPHEILLTATRNAARVFAAQPEFGTLEEGKLADMLVLDADPLADVANLQKIHAVIKGGQWLEPDKVLPPSPETVVQRQVEAYNRRDIDKFLVFYAKDVKIYRLPALEAVTEGLEAMRPGYATFFKENPQLNCRIMQRTVSGDFVVDHEFVTGVKKRPRLRAVAVYEVRDGLIRNVWFLPKE